MRMNKHKDRNTVCVVRTELMSNKWTAFDRREAENESVALDTLRF